MPRVRNLESHMLLGPLKSPNKVKAPKWSASERWERSGDRKRRLILGQVLMTHWNLLEVTLITSTLAISINLIRDRIPAQANTSPTKPLLKSNQKLTKLLSEKGGKALILITRPMPALTIPIKTLVPYRRRWPSEASINLQRTRIHHRVIIIRRRQILRWDPSQLHIGRVLIGEINLW